MQVRWWVVGLSATAGAVAVSPPRVKRLLRRYATLGGLTARSATRGGAHLARRLTADAGERADLDIAFQLRTADDVAATLGDMKGLFMKLGQLLSFVDDGMPEHVRAALSQLQDSAPPMSAALAIGVVTEELGRPPTALFATWDPAPIAAASIGQVHRATLRDGTDVAVKVQYPGVAEAMAADLAQLDLGKIVGALTPWNALDMEGVSNELRDRFTEELDYETEAGNQRDFARWYADHPFISIPAVVDDLSTRRVLTTAFGAGVRFAELERWSQAERDLAGETIFRFVYRSLNDHLAFNGDPHPGNYLFLPDGHVTFLDFGVVKRFTPTELAMEKAVAHAAAMEPDPATLRRAVEDVGYWVRGAPVTDEYIAEFSSLFWAHMAVDRPVTLDPAWASETVRRYLFKGEGHADVNRYGAFPPSFVTLQRITVGLFAILGRLNATANWHRIMRELWFAGEPASPLGQLEAEWRAAHQPTA